MKQELKFTRDGDKYRLAFIPKDMDDGLRADLMVELLKTAARAIVINTNVTPKEAYEKIKSIIDILSDDTEWGWEGAEGKIIIKSHR